MNLNNKVCLITGAARGIGAAIAKRYVEAGAKVAMADLQLEAAQETAAQLSAMGPGSAMRFGSRDGWKPASACVS